MRAVCVVGPKTASVCRAAQHEIGDARGTVPTVFALVVVGSCARIVAHNVNRVLAKAARRTIRAHLAQDWQKRPLVPIVAPVVVHRFDGLDAQIRTLRKRQPWGTGRGWCNVGWWSRRWRRIVLVSGNCKRPEHRQVLRSAVASTRPLAVVLGRAADHTMAIPQRQVHRAGVHKPFDERRGLSQVGMPRHFGTTKGLLAVLVARVSVERLGIRDRRRWGEDVGRHVLVCTCAKWQNRRGAPFWVARIVPCGVLGHE